MRRGARDGRDERCERTRRTWRTRLAAPRGGRRAGGTWRRWGAILVALAACGGESLPPTVDAHWVERCNGGATNVYGLTKERACTDAARGYENAGDDEHAMGYYRRACEIGVGDACLAWARLLRGRGNVAGERFVLGNALGCEQKPFAEACGLALVASYEKEEPTRPEEVRPVLRRLCAQARSREACARLEAMHDVPPAAHASAPPPAGTSAPSPAASSSPPSAPSSPSSPPPAPVAPAPSRPCRMMSACVQLEVHRVEGGSCDGALQVTVKNTCDRRVRCQWCQAKSSVVVDRSTCGGQEFDSGQTYAGAIGLCKRDERGENVAYLCSDADDPPSCTTP